GFRAETIEDYFRDGSKWEARISFGRQTELNGTGKAAEPARGFVGDSPFLLTYGDILVNPGTYKKIISRYQQGNFSGVITVTRGQDVTKGGLDFFDEQFCLNRLVEKPSPQQLEQLRREGLIQPGQPLWYNAGIYLFKPLIFELIAHLQPSA